MSPNVIFTDVAAPKYVVVPVINPVKIYKIRLLFYLWREKRGKKTCKCNSSRSNANSRICGKYSNQIHSVVVDGLIWSKFISILKRIIATFKFYKKLILHRCMR